MDVSGPARWFFRRVPRANPALRLFCVPFAGGGASAFNTWPSALPENVEVLAVQLPGRESRYREAPLTDLLEAARRIAGALEPYLDRSYALFGYSMGALVAFEVVRELRRRGAPPPAQLFVGAMRAPDVASTLPPMAELPDADLLRQVRAYYEPPAVAWENLDLLQLILPPLRADMALCERYVFRAEEPLDCAVQAFAGLRDRSGPLSAVQAWRSHTRGEFALEVFDGGHFFLNASLPRVQEVVASRLARALGNAGG
jgi:medium-chain acyl-[acyl-carrier-protein] hydrolase